MKNVHHGLPVQTSGGFELNHALGAPGNSESSSMEHEKVIGSIADSSGLGDGDVVLGRNGLQELALLAGIDNRVGGNEFSRQSLRCLVYLELHILISIPDHRIVQESSKEVKARKNIMDLRD